MLGTWNFVLGTYTISERINSFNPVNQFNGYMTVLEVIQRSTKFLAKKGVDSPRLQTELLLAHLLKLPRMQLYLNFERALSPVELDSLRDLVKRRGQREPLQHIVGSTSFCGLEIAVNRHVLIPRPETELLAELGWKFLSELSTLNSRLSTALDLGTGSGCLAIALAFHCPSTEVYATDVSPAALEVARQNATRHRLADRIQFSQGDGFAALPPRTRLDLIISNPPYVPTAEIETLQPEVSAYDPLPALNGGPDGLDFFRRLAAEAAPFLNPGGKIMLEFGDGQAESLRQIVLQQNWIVEAIQDDYTPRPRILIAKRQNSTTDAHG
jgi:release factor glutamine methyltransferase